MANIRKKPGKKGISWEVRIRLRGVPPLTKTFHSYEEATAWAREKEGDITKGVNVSTTAEKIGVSDAIDWYRKKHPSRPQAETIRLSIIEHDLGQFSVKALNHDRIDKYMKALLETAVPSQAKKKKAHPLYNGNRPRTYAQSSVRKIYYTLKKVVEGHAFAQGYPLDAAQFKQQKIPKAWSNKKERRFEGDEEARLFAAAMQGRALHAEWKNLLIVALETGMRAQELLLSTYKNLNLEKRALFLPSEIVKKTGKHLEGLARTVPLSLRAIAAFEAHQKTKKENEDRIFWQWATTNVLGHAFKRICARAKITNLTIHSLRHEATARFFEKNRLTDIQIMKITGHTEIKTLAGYYKYRPESVAVLLD